jgi:serine/threonine-protein kinase RsbW
LHDTQSSAEQAFTTAVVFAADIESMMVTRDNLMRFLDGYGISEDDQVDILVSLQEALANAVIHGCKNDSAKSIRCSLTITDDEIDIIVTDPGPGFDSGEQDSGASGPNLSEHGRGILLMRSLMDEVHYRHGGSEVRLRKLRKRPEA